MTDHIKQYQMTKFQIVVIIHFSLFFRYAIFCACSSYVLYMQCPLTHPSGSGLEHFRIRPIFPEIKKDHFRIIRQFPVNPVTINGVMLNSSAEECMIRVFLQN